MMELAPAEGAAPVHMAMTLTLAWYCKALLTK
jgi:hypothetical protein